MANRENIARQIARVQHPQLTIVNNAQVTPSTRGRSVSVYGVDAFGEQVDATVWSIDIDNISMLHPDARESVLKHLAGL